MVSSRQQPLGKGTIPSQSEVDLISNRRGQTRVPIHTLHYSESQRRRNTHIYILAGLHVRQRGPRPRERQHARHWRSLHAPPLRARSCWRCVRARTKGRREKRGRKRERCLWKSSNAQNRRVAEILRSSVSYWYCLVYICIVWYWIVWYV